jgi:hypothetical protein
MTNRVYEIVDASNDETYWPLGMFLTLDDAVLAIDTDYLESGSPLHEDRFDSEYITIEIRERAIGLSRNEKVVWSRSWSQQYSVDTDEYVWEVDE